MPTFAIRWPGLGPVLYSDFPALDFFSQGKKPQKPVLYSTFVPISISFPMGKEIIPTERHFFAGKKVGPIFVPQDPI